jgi:hypothetical protein
MGERESGEIFVDLQGKVKKTYYVCLVVQLAKGPLNEDEQNAIKRYTRGLGVQSWLHTFILLSYSKSIKPNTNFAAILRERSNALRYEIAKYAGWDIASAVPIIATHDFKTVMSEYPAWLVEQYAIIEQTAEISRNTSFFFALPEDAILPGVLPSPDSSHLNDDVLPRSAPYMSTASLPRYVIILSCLCVTSGPLAALGIIIAGPVGCSVALLANLILWAMLWRFFGGGIFSKDRSGGNS